MRKVRFLEWILGTPWVLWTILIVGVIVGAIWLLGELKESKEAEKRKSSDRDRGDSVWR